MIRKRAIMSCIYSRSHLLTPKYYHKFKESVFSHLRGWDALSSTIVLPNAYVNHTDRITPMSPQFDLFLVKKPLL